MEPLPTTSTTAFDAFQIWTGRRDPAEFRRSYLGSFMSRELFGTHLLDEFNAKERLQTLPGWLRGYVELVPERIVRDFEEAGYYGVLEVADGVHVFDRQALSEPAGKTCNQVLGVS